MNCGKIFSIAKDIFRPVKKKKSEAMKTNNVIADKSKQFALRIIKLHKYLVNEKNEYIMSKQILRSGTSIGANIREGLRGYSSSDFYFKFNLALKEAD